MGNKIIKILAVAIIALSLFACESTNDAEKKVKEVMSAEEMKEYKKGDVIKELPEKEINNAELEKRELSAVYVYEKTNKYDNGKIETQLTYTLKQHDETEEWENGKGISEYRFIELRVLEIKDYTFGNILTMPVGGLTSSCEDIPEEYYEPDKEVWVKSLIDENEESMNEDGSVNPLGGFILLPVENEDIINKLDNQK